MILTKHYIPLEPSFYIVVLGAGVQPVPSMGIGEIANIEYFQDTYIGYTKDEAVAGILKKLQAERPSLYQHGLKIGGWKATYINEIKATKMEQLFKQRAELEKKNEKDKLELEKNKLLQHIIKTKDVATLHKAIIDGKITDYERKYVHEKLTEALPDKVEYILSSPYDYE